MHVLAIRIGDDIVQSRFTWHGINTLTQRSVHDFILEMRAFKYTNGVDEGQQKRSIIVNRSRNIVFFFSFMPESERSLARMPLVEIAVRQFTPQNYPLYSG